MADVDRPLSEEEQEEEARRRQEGKPTLDEEIAQKYDPDRLGRLVVSGAGRGERLDLATRSEMERRLPGADFSRVRIFRGPLAEEVTQRHRADAVTIANTGMVLMRESPRSAPHTTSGQALLAHELTHVAQAQRGLHFAREGGSSGEQGAQGEAEAQAESVETGVKAGTAAAGKALSKAKEAEKQEAKRTKVIERVFELMEEEIRFKKERLGIL